MCQKCDLSSLLVVTLPRSRLSSCSGCLYRRLAMYLPLAKSDRVQYEVSYVLNMIIDTV